MAIRTATLGPEDIQRLLGRHRRIDNFPEEEPADALFHEILRIADQFVPSEAGSLLLDDPAIKIQTGNFPERNELVFVAAYGDKAEQLVGKRIRADQGIVGLTYISGLPRLSSDVAKDSFFSNRMDEAIGFTTRSVVSVPIFLERATVGVLELINRKGRPCYSQEELELLRIFARYISSTTQNMLDASKYRELAKLDDLTKLYNDRYFHVRLTEEMERAQRDGTDLTMVFIDLDRFKKVNDIHGHLVGSQTLFEVARLLLTTAAADGRCVARYGGDEFVIIYPRTDLTAAVVFAEEIRARVERAELVTDLGFEGSGRFSIAGMITASVGVVSFRDCRFRSGDQRARKNEFIRLADKAMYDAKSLGGNRVCTRSTEDDVRRP